LLEKMKIFKITTIFVCVFFTITICFSQSDRNEKYVDLEIKDGKLVYTVYKSVEVKAVDLSDLEIWEQTPTNNPVNVFVSNDPEIEFKVVMLKKGLAKLKDGIVHQDKLLNAQEEAKQRGTGLWKETKVQEKDTEKSTSGSSINSSESFNWLINKIISIAWYILPLSGLIGLITILFKFFKRRKLYIVLLGSRSSGKTTIFRRLFHPEDKPEECSSPKTTIKTQKKIANEQHNWGRYEVTPVYVDTAGGKFGEQASEMLKRDSLLKKFFFKSSKYVWVITLAPTDNSKVSKDSEDKDKKNEQFISEQFGYLSLPVAFLTGKTNSAFGKQSSLATPDLVMLCINKSDLFSNSPNDNEGKKKIEELFKKHITLIETTCKGGSFKFNCKIISACEGWDVHLVKRVIEKELY